MSDELFLLDDDVEEISDEKWNILVVDDDEYVHTITNVALKNVQVDGKKLNILNAMSAAEAKEVLAKNDDIALALIDVIMETSEAGLDLVNYIRNDIKNHTIRLVLRTGQPSQAPERYVIDTYDINDYKEKTELTVEKLYTLVRTSIKQYEIICSLQHEVEDVSSTLSNQKFAMDEHAIVAITDVAGNITYANNKFSEISGYSNEELIGNNHRILRSSRHNKEFWKNVYGQISRGNVWKGEICNRKKNGDLYWVDTTIVPFKDLNGIIQSYVAIRSDITKQKEAQEKMLQAKKIAEDAVAEKSEFFASMSHEIRTPMNGILGMLGLIKRSELNEVQTHQLRIAESSAMSLLTIINDILDFSKIEAGKVELENVEFNLRSEVGEIAESLAVRAEEKGVDIILDFSEVNYTTVKSDPVRIRQILNNIVGNSIKFTKVGHILIKVSLGTNNQEESMLNFEISDTGIGIPEDKLDTLFDSFSQVDKSTTREYGGTGLGLSITKNLCNIMGGDISVKSELNEGSTFYIGVKVEVDKKTSNTGPANSVDNKSILIVDNNKISSEVLKNQLEEWGMRVSVANSAKEALSICNYTDEAFDIALIDKNISDMDGIELTFELRMDIKYKGMKIALMTPIDSKVDLEHLKKIGINSFISKPVTTDGLFHILGTLNNGQHMVEEVESTEIDNGNYKWADNVKLLLVDDNAVNQYVAEEMLETMGIKADIASNGLEALEMLKKAPLNSPYTIVLMDCQMPLMDGYEATREIRNSGAGYAYVDIPIIAMTANALESDKEKSRECGMNDYLEKPITHKVLLKMLKKWIAE